MMRCQRRLLSAALAVSLLPAACSDDEKDPAPPGAPNQLPRAFAIASPSSVFEGDEVALDARGSSDDQGISGYQWIQVEGPDVDIANERGALTTFIAPEVTQVAYVRLELEVADTLGFKSRYPFTVTVIDTNASPVARPGADQRVAARSTVTLDGTASSDNDGPIRIYRWQQVAQTGIPNVSISSSSSATATFTAPDVTSPIALQFRLTVTDNEGSSSSDTVYVIVDPAPAQLAVTGVPASVVRNTVVDQLQVQIRNAAGGLIVNGDASDLEVELEVVTGTGELRGTLVSRAGRGVAIFDDVVYDTAEEDVVFRAVLVDAPAVEGQATMDVTWPSSIPAPLRTDSGVVVNDTLIAPNGEVVIAGQFSGVTNFALHNAIASRTASGTSDGFVARYNTAGLLNWVYVVSSPGADIVSSVALDDAGHVVAGGSLGGSFNFGTESAPIQPTYVSGWDGMLFELDGAGAAVWAVTLSGAGEQAVLGVARGGGSVYAVGWFENAVDFDLGAGTALETAIGGDGFTVAYDREVLAGASGTALQWKDVFGTNGADVANAAVLAGDSLYVAGGRDDGADMVLKRYATGGALTWLRVWAPTTGGPNYINDLAVGEAGPFITGSFAGELDLDPNAGERLVTSAGLTDAFLIGLSSAGDLRLGETFGGSGQDAGRSLVAPPAATGLEVVVVGNFLGTVDFAPGSAVVTRSVTAGAFIVGLGPESALRWAGAWEAGGQVVIGQGGQVPALIAAAQTSGLVDMDPSSHVVHATVDDLGSFVVKLDTQGGVAP